MDLDDCLVEAERMIGKHMKELCEEDRDAYFEALAAMYPFPPNLHNVPSSDN